MIYIATISKLGMVLIHVIQHFSLAQQFVNQDAFDHVQLFNDLDNVLIQRTKYSLADHVNKFWSMKIEPNELFQYSCKG